MSRVVKAIGPLALLVALDGCTWKSDADDFKQKWIQESRYHFQTQMIKSAEIEQLQKENVALRKQVEELTAKVKQN